MKTPTGKHRKLLAKLTALAERGVNGERDNASVALAKLKAEYDFTKRDTSEANLFAGVFIRASTGITVHKFRAGEMDLAGNVKWAIEQATAIRCSFRNCELIAEVRDDSAAKLSQIAATIAAGFGQLWATYASAPGVAPGDKQAFVMGLYDGLMGESRAVGQRLPGRYVPAKRRARSTKPAGTMAPGLDLHPYQVAVGLGGQIRGLMPLDGVNAQLENLIKGEIEA